MKTNILASLLWFVAVAGAVCEQDADEKKEPVTTSLALKVGEDGLTEYTGLSEVGQDEAAEFYAAATRITTEQALGEKNLQLVLELENWRDLISACRRSIDSLAYFVNGGGTMYSHGERRDVSSVEKFLADFSKSLPLRDGQGDPKAAQVIDRTIALIKNLRAPQYPKSQLTEAVKRAAESFTHLKEVIAGIPAADARKIVTFATDGVSGWLLDDNDEGKKFEQFRSVLKK
jgi:hypothetical protein